jgi:hypothetical protein
MTQTKFQSLVESMTGVAIGYVVAVLSQLLIFPLFGIKTSMTDNLLIAGYFTIISIIRSYLVRRWFNKRHEWQR